MGILVVGHNGGIFSCYTVKLRKIIEYFNNKKKLPKYVDCSKLFTSYKTNENEDLSKYFLSENEELTIEYINEIKISNTNDEDQFSNYNFLNFNLLNFFIKKYFKLNENIINIINFLEKKYEIDYDNTISVLYRSNDKVTETNIGSYETFYQKINECLFKNPNMKVLIQTDDQNFLDYCVSKLNDKIIFFNEIPRINNNPRQVIHDLINKNDRKTFALNFVAITKILSKTKILITHSGNCGMWAVFFRGNMENVHQYLNPLNNKNNNKIGWQ